jgi:hypothetical protein
VRVVKSILILLYLLSSLPVLASYHYCLGRVKQISFYETSYADCVCPAPEESRDCCDDEQALLDFQDDHAGSAYSLVLSFDGAELVLPMGFEVAAVQAQMLGLPRAHAPPLLTTNSPLFVQHQAFLL